MASNSLANRFTSALDRGVQKWLPDPLVIVLAITIIIFLCGIIFQGAGPVAMLTYWGDGFWALLSFAMQMMLVLVTGHVLASSPVVKNSLDKLAGFAKTPGQAIVLVTLVAMTASWVNWGFGLVVGALFARAVGRKVPATDYRVLIASAYSGFLIWHAGFSGSVPLTAATAGNFLEQAIGLIPTSQTIFAPFNLIIVALLIVILPLVNRSFLNHGGKVVLAGDVMLEEEKTEKPVTSTPAERLENSRLLSIGASVIGLGYVVVYFVNNGFSLNLNIVNMLFLFLGILLHGTPRNYLNALQDAISGTAGILIQFPFYAGIMGMMTGSGMAASITTFFISIASATTLPLIAFFSAGFVNILVPSGGGQWAVQGPIMMEAAKTLSADIPRVAMAVAWGDAWTNMIQPFWALPALGIAGLKARDIMGFCIVILAISGVVIGAGLLLLP